MESAHAKAVANKVIMYVILTIMAFIMIVPFVWMILTALKTNQEAISVSPFYIFPHNGWHWENFATVWKSYNFLILYKNAGFDLTTGKSVSRKSEWGIRSFRSRLPQE